MMAAFFRLVLAFALMANGAVIVVATLENVALAGGEANSCDDDGCDNRSNVNNRDCNPAGEKGGCKPRGGATCKCDEQPDSTSKCYCKRTD